jgi:hypothetical protein
VASAVALQWRGPRGIIPMDNSDAVMRGYDNCGKAVVGEIAFAGAADVPVAEECVCVCVCVCVFLASGYDWVTVSA